MRPKLFVGAILAVVVVAAAVPSAEPERPAAEPANAYLTALLFAHQYGTPEALTADKDRQLKVSLIPVAGEKAGLTWELAKGFLDEPTFRKHADGGTAIPIQTIERLIQAKTLPSRKDMNEKTRRHADLLTTQFDRIEEAHRKPVGQLADWIVKSYRPGKPLGAVAVCSHNTRRSAMTAAMGNVAATYYGLTDLRFHSAGVAPDAINPRTIATLAEIGVEFIGTGREAARGEADHPNPIHRVRWGKGFEALEFSKKHTDASIPRENFAALLVCGEADKDCPNVEGAGARIAMPFLDPKVFDGAPFEAAKYAERRDDIGRFLLSAMMQARRRLELNGTLK